MRSEDKMLNNKKMKKRIIFKKENTNLEKEIEISTDRKLYLKNIRIKKFIILFFQIFILIGFLALWEVLANQGYVDEFITSKPSRILKTFMNLTSNDLLKHIGVTSYETIVGFLLGTTIGTVIAIILWWSEYLSKIFEPYLVVLNSLPKVALRTYNYYLGGSRNSCNNCYGCCDFVNCNYFRKLKWLLRDRQRINKNGKNI